jgi:hypothetical protein
MIEWSIVRIHGIESARIMILKFTFFLKEQECQSVDDAGLE